MKGGQEVQDTGQRGDMTRQKVFVTRRIPSPGIELLSERCDVSVHEGGSAVDRQELLRHIRDKEGLLCVPGDPIDREVLDAAPLLTAISTFSVGYDHIDVAEATRRGIFVGYTPGTQTDATADLAFTLLLAAARRIGEADRYVRAEKWRGPFEPMSMLGESVWQTTLGVVGFGRIGQAMAIRAHGFRMRVLYYSPHRLNPAEEHRLGAEYRDLNDLLSVSDFVSLHVPYSEKTHHLIGEKELKLMKRTAVFINTSRGAAVDESALIAALRSGLIRSAGLDVFEHEPLRCNSALLQMENIVLTPHIGARTEAARRDMAELAARNLLAALRGDPPLQWVNPEAAKRGSRQRGMDHF
jgi:glyoxylate reductase